MHRNSCIPYRLLGILLFWFAGTVERSWAVESASPEVTLSELIRTAVEMNPDIQAARSMWAQTVEKYPQETALEDPMLNVSYYVENVETRVGAQNYAVGINQKIPFPGTLRQKGRVVEKEIAIAELNYQKAVRDTLAELKKQVYEMRYIEGAIETTRNNQELLRQILAYAQAQYANQRVALSDVMGAESQLAQLDYDLVTLRELRIVQVSIINGILNRPVDEEIPAIIATIPASVTTSFEVLDPLIQEQNQEIRISELGIDKADAGIQLARSMNRPTFTIGANYIGTGHAIMPNTAESGKDPIIVGGGITIPLWVGKNRARVRYAQEGKVMAEQNLQSVANSMKVNLRKATFRLENARRLMELYRDHLIPQSQQSVELAQEWNRDQKGSLAEILESQSVWLNFNLAFLRAQTDYAQAWTDVERLCGGSLQAAMEKE